MGFKSCHIYSENNSSGSLSWGITCFKSIHILHSCLGIHGDECFWRRLIGALRTTMVLSMKCWNLGNITSVQSSIWMGASEVVACWKAPKHTMHFHQDVAFLFMVESHAGAAPQTLLAWIICRDLGLGQIRFLYICSFTGSLAHSFVVQWASPVCPSQCWIARDKNESSPHVFTHQALQGTFLS